MTPGETLDAGWAAWHAAACTPVDVSGATLDGVLQERGLSLWDRPVVHVISTQSDHSTDVMALRWMARGGHCPLVFCASDFATALDLGYVAGRVAQAYGGPAYVLVEHAVDALQGQWREPAAFSVAAPPGDMPDSPSDRMGRRQDLYGALPQFSAMDADPAGARAEWLVLSYGANVHPASQAVAQARQAGQRVHHLALHTLWPLPEAAILKAAMGVKHVVVPESNLGQYVNEIRRILPMLTVIPANAAAGPVPAGLILERLQKTPRCC